MAPVSAFALSNTALLDAQAISTPIGMTPAPSAPSKSRRAERVIELGRHKDNKDFKAFIAMLQELGNTCRYDKHDVSGVKVAVMDVVEEMAQQPVPIDQLGNWIWALGNLDFKTTESKHEACVQKAAVQFFDQIDQLSPVQLSKAIAGLSRAEAMKGHFTGPQQMAMLRIMEERMDSFDAHSLACLPSMLSRLGCKWADLPTNLTISLWKGIESNKDRIIEIDKARDVIPHLGELGLQMSALNAQQKEIVHQFAVFSTPRTESTTQLLTRVARNLRGLTLMGAVFADLPMHLQKHYLACLQDKMHAVSGPWLFRILTSLDRMGCHWTSFSPALANATILAAKRALRGATGADEMTVLRSIAFSHLPTADNAESLAQANATSSSKGFWKSMPRQSSSSGPLAAPVASKVTTAANITSPVIRGLTDEGKAEIKAVVAELTISKNSGNLTAFIADIRMVADSARLLSGSQRSALGRAFVPLLDGLAKNVSEDQLAVLAWITARFVHPVPRPPIMNQIFEVWFNSILKISNYASVMAELAVMGVEVSAAQRDQIFGTLQRIAPQLNGHEMWNVLESLRHFGGTWVTLPAAIKQAIWDRVVELADLPGKNFMVAHAIGRLGLNSTTWSESEKQILLLMAERGFEDSASDPAAHDEVCRANAGFLESFRHLQVSYSDLPGHLVEKIERCLLFSIPGSSKRSACKVFKSLMAIGCPLKTINETLRVELEKAARFHLPEAKGKDHQEILQAFLENISNEVSPTSQTQAVLPAMRPAPRASASRVMAKASILPPQQDIALPRTLTSHREMISKAIARLTAARDEEDVKKFVMLLVKLAQELKFATNGGEQHALAGCLQHLVEDVVADVTHDMISGWIWSLGCLGFNYEFSRHKEVIDKSVQVFCAAEQISGPDISTALNGLTKLGCPFSVFTDTQQSSIIHKFDLSMPNLRARQKTFLLSNLFKMGAVWSDLTDTTKAVVWKCMQGDGVTSAIAALQLHSLGGLGVNSSDFTSAQHELILNAARMVINNQTAGSEHDLRQQNSMCIRGLGKMGIQYASLPKEMQQQLDSTVTALVPTMDEQQVFLMIGSFKGMGVLLTAMKPAVQAAFQAAAVQWIATGTARSLMQNLITLVDSSVKWEQLSPELRSTIIRVVDTNNIPAAVRSYFISLAGMGARWTDFSERFHRMVYRVILLAHNTTPILHFASCFHSLGVMGAQWKDFPPTLTSAFVTFIEDAVAKVAELNEHDQKRLMFFLSDGLSRMASSYLVDQAADNGLPVAPQLLSEEVEGVNRALRALLDSVKTEELSQVIPSVDSANSHDVPTETDGG